MNSTDHTRTSVQVSATFGEAKLEETAIAICINGISQAVMMATAKDLINFGLGFSLSEGLITSPVEVVDITTTSLALGVEINLTVLARSEHRLKARRRSLTGPTGCGLCGIDSLTDAMTLPDTRLKAPSLLAPHVIEQAKQSLTQLQKDHHCIQGHHSAAYFDFNGQFIAIAEDVGRHSALDKLIGGLYGAHSSKLAEPPAVFPPTGFILLTSRCSHDLVIKAARAKLSHLVTLAQPTTLAVASARSCGLTLFSFVHGKLTQFSS